MTMRGLAVLLVAVTLAIECSAQCPYTSLPGWVASGLATSGDVLVPAGTNVTFDLTGTVTMNSLIIQGTVAFADAAVNLNIGFIKVNESGRLLLGSPSCPLTSKIVITLTGTRTTLSPIGQEGGALGAKGIVGTTGATIEIFGSPPALIWTRLSATALKGTSSIQVQDIPTGWANGQSVLITTTDFSTIARQTYFPDQNEVRIIQGISGNTITLDKPLNYTHWGIWPENAEVAVLDRNIIIQGDAPAEDPISGAGFGGHILLRDNNSNMRIDGIELTRMGQTGVLGRYPVHWHVVTDKVGQNNYIKRSSIHDNFQRCVTIHDTNGILVESNVAYSTIGHCFFLEDGSEQFNTYNHNLGVKVTSNDWATGPYTRPIPSDTQPVIFWITNLHNTWTNNVAVGNATFGYWASLPQRPNGISAAKYANADILPRLYPLIAFDNNTVHGTSQNGFHCDDGQNPDGTIQSTIHWSPSTGPYNTTTNGYPVTAYFNDFRAWKVRDHGVWMRGSPTVWTRYSSISNGRGMDLVPGPHLVRDSYFECESANPGSVMEAPWNPVYGRSRPVWYNTKIPICGYEHYDASGPVFLDGNTFTNCKSDQYRNASAHCMQRNTKNIHQPSFRLRDLTYSNSDVWFLERWPNAYDSSPEQDNVKAAIMLDTDGTSYGVLPNGWAVSPEDVITYGLGCTFRPDWQMALCPPFREGFTLIAIENTDPGNTDFKGTDTANGNTDPYWYRGTWYGLGDYNGDRKMPIVGMDISSNTRTLYRMNGPMRRGYTLRFANDHPTPPQLKLSMEVAAEGEWVVIALPYPQSTTFTITRGYAKAPLTAASSLSELGPLKYFYDPVSSHLFVKVTTMAGDSSIQTPFGPDYAAFQSYWAQYYVQASCTSSACLGPNLNIPAPIPITEDFYIAALQSCQVTPAVSYTGTGQGIAYFSLDPATKLLTYNIYHNLGTTVTGGGIYNAASGATGPRVALFANYLSPIRGSVAFTNSLWVKLTAGELYVSLSTSGYTGGLLRGQIGCDTTPKGACTFPAPSVPAIDMCNIAGTNVVPIYTDDLASNGRASWSWSGSTYVFNSTAAAACGTYGISVYGVGAFASGPVYNAPPITLQPTQSLQFLIKNPNWPDEYVSVLVSLTDTNDVVSTWVDVNANPQYVDNYWVSSEWTRVRVPLTAMGITAPYNLKVVTIRPSYWNLNRTFYLDDIKFITPATETTTTPALASAIANYACSCGNCPATSAPIPTAGPAPPAPPGVPTSSGPSGGSGSSSGSSKSAKNNTPMIAGIVVAVIVVAVIAAAAIFYFAYWRPNHSMSSSAAYE